MPPAGFAPTPSDLQSGVLLFILWGRTCIGKLAPKSQF